MKERDNRGFDMGQVFERERQGTDRKGGAIRGGERSGERRCERRMIFLQHPVAAKPNFSLISHP